jgi:N-acetylmuramoyl-L-alanine amidase
MSGRHSCLLAVLLCGFTLPLFPQQQPQDIVLGFDGLSDLSSNVDSFGVHFTGATVLACGGSLNCIPFPPFSGRNVIYDDPIGGGVITATFDATAGSVDRVSARVTGNLNVTMTAFDVNGVVLGTAQTGGPNSLQGGNTLLPNILLTVTSTTAPIAKVTLHDHGNTYTVDDFTFRGRQHIIVLDPGHGRLLDTTGGLHFQRQPTANFNLIEDTLTLQIAKVAANKLQADKYQVYLTRTTDLAPISSLGQACTESTTFDYCNADLRLRVQATEKQNQTAGAIFVSVHTNGSILPNKSGTEAFNCWSESIPLSQNLLADIVALGTSSRGVSNGCGKGVLKDLTADKIQNSLIEVAYHSNTFNLLGGTTDESRLNDPTFRLNAGLAVAQAIEDFIKSLDVQK